MKEKACKGVTNYVIICNIDALITPKSKTVVTRSFFFVYAWYEAK